MTLAELQRLLHEKEPAAVLVSPRILERVVREGMRLPALHWGLPHGKSYVCGRQMLFRHAEQADLEVEPGRLLPEKVILLSRPDAEEMSNIERPRVLLKYWRRLFHSMVHLMLNERRAGGPLNDDEVRGLSDELGLAEFAEVRQVLIHDGYLPEGATSRETYIEFAAVYLELRHFAPGLERTFFPGIRDFAKVERMLARHLDARALFEQTKLKDAPDPIQPTEVRAAESQEAFLALVRQAQKAALDDNHIKAAILRMKASRIAPGAETVSTRKEAEADIGLLTDRLAKALSLSEPERAEWTHSLVGLLEKADQGAWPVEARLLDDVQKVCEDSEREIYTLDLVDYAMSVGKRPIRRALPSQRIVLVMRHLESAGSRLQEVRLPDPDRAALGNLLSRALKASTANLKDKFRPVLEAALEDVGLRPTNPVENVAFEKMVGELLDRITVYGFISFTDLRDAISRNQLKMPDTSDPESLWRGDPLTRLDGRLASLLDGVYRPSDFYIRWLERGTGLLFGTPPGRALTRFVLMPLLLAWAMMYVTGLLLGWVMPASKYPTAGDITHVLLGPLHFKKASDVAETHPPPHWAWNAGLLAGVSLLALGLLESEGFRHRVARGLVVTWCGLRWLFWRLPMGVVPLEGIRRALGSWLFQAVFWIVFVPGAVVALVLWLVPEIVTHATVPFLLYACIAYLVNSRWARLAVETTRDLAAHAAQLVRSGLLPGLVRLTMQVFKRISDMIEGGLHMVDEWLRFRGDDGPWSVGVRAVLSLVWMPVAFLIRFVYVVLIEPFINPLKLPISVLAGKVMYSLYFAIGAQEILAAQMSILMWAWLAHLLVAAFLFLLPDAFGFLGWEMKENWRLYRANRPRVIEPQPIGSHGETVRALLQPGFHSGTVPQLYGKLRAAEKQAARSRNWNKVRQYRQDLHHVEESLANFLRRDLVALLKQSTAWKGAPIEGGEVYLATNRVRFPVRHEMYPGKDVQIEIQHHHGWLLAGLRDPGWLAMLPAEKLDVFVLCLAGFYKQAGVDLVREQLEAKLPPPVEVIECTEDELLVRPTKSAASLHYALRDRLGFPNLDGPLRDKVFAWSDILWDDWVNGWQEDQAQGVHPGLPGVDLSLVNLASPARKYASQMELPVHESGLGAVVVERQI